jgi:adenine-specific DNA-methyltransferase
LFNIALELCITWINRILFLKLLEGQLLTYHAGDKSYRFLDFKTIPNYDELNKLFFQVLARKESERTDAIREKFARVPYLNSSLFDISDLEDDTLRINSLHDGLKLRISGSTVLKTENGKKREGEIPTLQYLYEFLDAYDFSSEGKEEIQEENKALINASVLGLIFEKINGYKDGSFFTPGFITMYMCRETIRRAVVQKFNEAEKWQLEKFEQLYNKIDDVKEANGIINSLKICDPAVGSGHFLVSALNEIIAIKSELGILTDRKGNRLREYAVEVVNDELIVSTGHNEFFEYKPGNKESQRVQEALFHEKQTLIENCLFGVDINPNSVKICRLRLWIELLKNAYYTTDSKFTELETLPNIDINIKQGNSLISRFALDADLSKSLKSIKYNIDDYRAFVNHYKNATDKEEKRGFEKLIEQIKKDFRTEIGKNDPKVMLMSKRGGELYNLLNQARVFEPTDKEKKEHQKRKEKLEAEINKLAVEIEEIKSSAIYKDAFEWRFEFPEVLDKEGMFIGFDAVIGNPPYIRIQDLRQTNEVIVDYYNRSFYSTNSGNYDLYVPFVELGHRILKVSGDFCFIMPHKFMNANYGAKIREFISDNSFLRRIIHFGARQVFVDATTYTGLFFMSKGKNDVIEFLQCNDFDDLNKSKNLIFEENPAKCLEKQEWFFLDNNASALLQKLVDHNSTLEGLTDRIFQGLKTSADKIYIVEKLSETKNSYEIFCRENEQKYVLEKSLLLPLIKGGDSRPFQISDTDLLILFPYKKERLLTEDELKKLAPETLSYLNDHKEYLQNRENGKMIGNNWYGYVYPKALTVISEPKIFTPDIAPSPRFSFDEKGVFMFTGGVSGGYGIIPKSGISPKYLMAVLNSPITAWYISKISTQMRGGWYSFESRYIKSIPIPKQPKSIGKLEKKVDEIMSMKEPNSAVRDSIRSEINNLIYQLYELTEDEIKIVEGN